MSNPTLNDVMAVNPVLQNMLVAYFQEADRFVASKVFPEMGAATKSGTYYIFDKKYWFLDELEQRAPGTEFARIDFAASTSTYDCLQWAADYALADEVRAASQVPMDLEQAAVRFLAQRALIRKEVAFSADFMTTGVWGNDDNNSTTDWDDYASGDPVTDILTAARTISNETGKGANTIALGYIVHNAIVNHPDILDRMKYTQAATQANVESILASLLGLENYWVAKGVYSNTNEAADYSATAIIDDDALICNVDPGAGVFGATAGKTFVWGPGGGGGSMYSDRENQRHADVVQFKMQWDQVAVATDLGYFFADVV
jgi:hypothetical protein